MIKPALKKVFVERSDIKVSKMFIEEGWDLTSSVYESDLLCLVGGADVSPMLYDYPKHPSTNSDPRLDERTFELYWEGLYEVPMVGICRGAQFLNIVSGGILFQDVDGHRLNNHKCHKVTDIVEGRDYEVTSTHHQMMIPDKDSSETILIASESSYRHTNTGKNKPYKDVPEVEACWYRDSNSLCFQPHPEYVDVNHECRRLFFNLMENYLF